MSVCVCLCMWLLSGCGSKIGPQNGTLVNGNKDKNLRSNSWFHFEPFAVCVFVCCICVLVFVCGCYVFPSRCAEKAAGGAGDLQRRKGCAVSRGSAPEKPKALGVEMSVRTLGGTFGDIFFLLLSRIIHMCLLVCCLLPVFLFFSQELFICVLLRRLLVFRLLLLLWPLLRLLFCLL